MKKVIIFILLIGTIVSLYFGISKYIEFSNKDYEKNTIEKLDQEIKNVEVEIENKEKEIKQAEIDNKEVLEEVELWQEKVKKIKSYLS